MMRRSLIRVVAVEDLPEGNFLRLIVIGSVMGYNEATRFPAEQFPRQFRKLDARFFAHATIDAERHEDVEILPPFELAPDPDPDPNDGLAR